MKVAIPIFNNRVSPRFEYAPTLLLATVENNKALENKELSIKDYDVFRRCALIRELGVDTLICGGITGFISRLLDGKNVRIVSPISGEVEEVLECFLQGKLDIAFEPLCVLLLQSAFLWYNRPFG